MKCRLKRASSSRLGEILHWKEEENTREMRSQFSQLLHSCIYKPTPLFILAIQTSADAFSVAWNSVPYLKDKHCLAFTALFCLQCFCPTLCYSPCSWCAYFQEMWAQKYGCKHLKTSSPSILPRNYTLPKQSSARPHHFHNGWLCWIKQLNAKSLKIRKMNQTGTL